MKYLGTFEFPLFNNLDLFEIFTQVFRAVTPTS